MYHPGKVSVVLKHEDKDVKSADDSTQATLEMWDENIITCIVEKKIAGKIKENDIALVDYGPVSDKVPISKHNVIKIVSGKKGSKLWSEYKDYYSKKRMEATRQQTKSYMG